jgi:hypothetical protein
MMIKLNNLKKLMNKNYNGEIKYTDAQFLYYLYFKLKNNEILNKNDINKLDIIYNQYK